MAAIDRPFYNYPGNKNQNGLLQLIINTMPPHEAYGELFLGSGAILAAKKPAKENLGNDIDPAIIHSWKQLYCRKKNFKFRNESAVIVMNDLERSTKKWLFYLDPPYVRETRRSSKDIYNYEISTRAHIDILNCVTRSPHNIIISGYDCSLYNKALKSWNKKSVRVMTRAGIAEEIIWYNFQDPIDLHDYSKLGNNFTDRQRIKRKVNRWVKKFHALPILEKNLIYASLTETSMNAGSDSPDT